MKALSLFFLLVLLLWLLASASCSRHIQDHLAQRASDTLNGALAVSVSPASDERPTAVKIEMDGRKPIIRGELIPPEGTVDPANWLEDEKAKIQEILNQNEDSLDWDLRLADFEGLKLGFFHKRTRGAYEKIVLDDPDLGPAARVGAGGDTPEAGSPVPTNAPPSDVGGEGTPSSSGGDGTAVEPTQPNRAEDAGAPPVSVVSDPVPVPDPPVGKAEDPAVSISSNTKAVASDPASSAGGASVDVPATDPTPDPPAPSLPPDPVLPPPAVVPALSLDTMPTGFQVQLDPETLSLRGAVGTEDRKTDLIEVAMQSFPNHKIRNELQVSAAAGAGPLASSLPTLLRNFAAIRGASGSLTFDGSSHVLIDGEFAEEKRSTLEQLGKQAGVQTLRFDPDDPVDLAGPPLNFRLTYTNQSVLLEGELPSRSDVANTVAAARGAFPGLNVASDLRPTSAPVVWMPRLQDLLATFSRMLDGKQGSLTIENGGDLEIHGEVKKNARAAFGALAEGIAGIQLPGGTISIETP